MDIEEYKKLAKNKIEADSLTRQVRNVIKETKWQKQDMREGFKETFKPLIESQESVKKSIDEQQNKTLAQLQANQLALTQGLNQNRLAITEGFNKLDEVKKWDLAQLPGLEAIEDDTSRSDKETQTENKEQKTIQLSKDFFDRGLMNKTYIDILEEFGYELPSTYFEKSINDIENSLATAITQIEQYNNAIRNKANIIVDRKIGARLAVAKSKNPHQQTKIEIDNYNALSYFIFNLHNVKEYLEKSGSGITLFNNPHQLLDRLELLGGSILAGNNGVIPEFSKIAHLLNQMKVITKKQLNDLLKTYITIR